LTSAEALKNRYRLDVAEEEVDAKERSSVPDPPPGGIGRVIARLKPEIYTIKGQIIQSNNSTMNRLRWATMGKDKADSIIKDISDINSMLHRLLDSLERERRRLVNEVLLRDILSQASTASEVEQIQQILEPSSTSSNESIKAAATLRQIRLYITNDVRDVEVKTSHSKERSKPCQASSNTSTKG
jgi:hypothetical protein